jgi:RNA polymerase sigma factor (TIGR02999 family)
MQADLEVTQLLNNHHKESHSLGDVYSVLYNDIKNMANYQLSRLPSGSTITPTVLAHEAYERIYKSIPKNYNDREHFLRSLGVIMRNFLIDLLRSKNSLKHGEKIEDYTLASVIGDNDIGHDMIEFDKALSFISEIDPNLTQVLELKLLFGFTFEEISELIGISSRQSMRRWKQAKALLISVLQEND